MMQLDNNKNHLDENPSTQDIDWSNPINHSWRFWRNCSLFYAPALDNSALNVRNHAPLKSRLLADPVYGDADAYGLQDFIPSPTGGAGWFFDNGTGDFIRINNSGTNAEHSAITVHLLCTPSEASGQLNNALAFGRDWGTTWSSPFISWKLTASHGSSNNWGMQWSSSITTFASTVAVVADKTVSVTCSIANGTQRFWIDGINAANASVGNSLTYSSGGFNIGRHQGITNSQFRGTIHAAMLFNRIIDNDEAYQLAAPQNRWNMLNLDRLTMPIAGPPAPPASIPVLWNTYRQMHLR